MARRACAEYGSVECENLCVPGPQYATLWAVGLMSMKDVSRAQSSQSEVATAVQEKVADSLVVRYCCSLFLEAKMEFRSRTRGSALSKPC